MKTAITDSYKKFREYEGPAFYNDFEKNFAVTPELVGAKNDEIYFQLVMADKDEFAYSVGREPFFTVQGLIDIYRIEVVLDGTDLSAECFPEDFADDDDGLRYSDILLKSCNRYCKKHQIGIVFVKINVPVAARAGKRSGKINIYTRVMTEDERLFASLPFEFDIYDYAIPQGRDRKFCLDLWQHSANIARYHEVGLFSDEHFALLENYVKSLAELGQRAVTLVASDGPWCSQKAYNHVTGQSDLFEYAMFFAVKDKNGNFRFDFSPMKRYAELCFRHGITEEIDVFGLIGVWQDEAMKLGSPIAEDPAAPRLRYYDEADGCYKYMRNNVEKDLYFSALMDFFKKEGWLEKLKIIADEPADWDVYYKQKCHFEKLYPDIKYKTAINHVDALKNIDHKNTDIAPFIMTIGSDGDWLRKYAAKKSSSKIYYYVCGGPKFPNTFILSNLLECRLVPILAKHLGIDGFLRWNYTVWPKDPRRELHYMFHSGDLNFVYPSRGGDVLYSLRYFALKSGIVDFELLSAADGATREKCLKTLIKDGDFYSRLTDRASEEAVSLEYADYVGVKKMLLEELSGKI